MESSIKFLHHVRQRSKYFITSALIDDGISIDSWLEIFDVRRIILSANTGEP